MTGARVWPESWNISLRAFESLDPQRREALRDDLLGLARRHDRNGGAGPIAITADYLETVIVRA